MRTDLLYAVDTAFRAVLDRADAYASEHDGEIPETLDAELSALGMSRDDLLESHVRELRNVEARENAHNDEATRQGELAGLEHDRAERIKGALARVLGVGNKWASTTAKLSWHTAYEAIIAPEVTPESLPKDCQRIVPAVPEHSEFDKNAIKAAIRGGREIPGCSVKDKHSLTVK